MKTKQLIYCLLLIVFYTATSITKATATTNAKKILPPVAFDGKTMPNTDITGVERYHDAPLPERPDYPYKQQNLTPDGRQTVKSGTTYTYAQLNAMAVTDAVNTILAMDSWRDLSDAFIYSQGAADFYHNNELITALLTKLKEFGETWTATDQTIVNKMSLLVEILRAGPYLGFYNSSMSDVNDMSFKNRFIEPIMAIMNNPAWGWSPKHGLTYSDKPIQDQVIAIVGAFCGSGATSPEMLVKVTALVKEFNDKDLMRDPAKADAIYAICGGIDYALYWSVVVNNYNKETSPYYNKINDYVAELARIALYGMNIGSDRVYVELNDIYWLVNGAGLVTPKEIIIAILRQCLDLYPKGSVQWMEVISRISYNYPDDFPEINFEQLKQEIQNEVLPLKYVFDNGKRVFVTGNNVDPEKVKMLYWATKEVKDDFERLLLNDQPIDGYGRADDVLTAYIYNSPAEYRRYNGFLYGLSTNNGGMYIEGWGKFFTYERTIYESTLSLEDLFRHEFTHYLQGRYLCPGDWGAYPLYSNERMTWVEEGGAEFQAGSSRTNSVTQRAVMVAGISDDPNYRMTLHDVIHAKYASGFTFYTYAYVAYQFMYERHPELLFRLFKLIQSGDVIALDAFITSFADNYENEYQQYMAYIKSQQNTYTDPETPYDYFENVAFRDETSIFNEISSLTALNEVQTSTFSSKDFNTFEVRGKFELGTSVNETTDRLAMDQKANDLLKNVLTIDKWNGYKTVTAHFTQYEVTNGKAYFELVFSGLLPTKTEDTAVGNVSPDLFSFTGISPNPAKDHCIIGFTTYEPTGVSLNIYDTSGKLVKKVLERELQPGTHTAEINLSAFRPGVYICTLTAGKRMTTKKLVVGR